MGATSNDGNQEEEEQEQEEVAQQPELVIKQNEFFDLSKTDLTVCEIIGDWGPYQWSLILFALIYSALAGCFVVVGPIWTPDMNHVCKPLNYNKTMDEIGSIFRENTTTNQRECFVQLQSIEREIEPNLLEQTTSFNSQECSEFIYDDEKYGKVLTNTPTVAEIVCIKFIITRFGRINCLKIGFVISLLATIGAMLANNYLSFNLCMILMSFSQMGCANANCTLVMESTSPRLRFIAVFQFGFGWGVGVFLVPILNNLTKNYQYFLLVTLIMQIIMLIWFHFGVFESIRWLLSEGQINRAQIELQRACRMNRVKNGAGLAQKIAQVQVQQVRKASMIIAEKTAPLSLVADIERADIEISTRKLSSLDEAIRRSFPVLNTSDYNEVEDTISPNRDNSDELQKNQTNLPLVLSPTLARKSISITSEALPAQLQLQQQQQQQLCQQSIEVSVLDRISSQARQSITTQCLIQLALKYGKNLQQQDEGSFFLSKMFHKKLYKATIMLMMESVMLEMAYYGLVQTNGFVGPNIDLNYMAGALSEWIAAGAYLTILYIFSRRIALILPTIVSATICLGIAFSYHVFPNNIDTNTNNPLFSSIQMLNSSTDSKSLIEPEERLYEIIADQNRIFEPDLSKIGESSQGNELLTLRETINFWLTTIGKLTVTVAIQVAATITMEYYPNNLRQTACGAIVFVGRAGSVLAPFLFNDLSEEKIVFKVTLISISVFGFIVCFMVPFLLRDTKDKELCDSMNEIKDDVK